MAHGGPWTIARTHAHTHTELMLTGAQVLRCAVCDGTFRRAHTPCAPWCPPLWAHVPLSAPVASHPPPNAHGNGGGTTRDGPCFPTFTHTCLDRHPPTMHLLRQMPLLCKPTQTSTALLSMFLNGRYPTAQPPRQTPAHCLSAHDVHTPNPHCSPVHDVHLRRYRVRALAFARRGV